MRGLFPAALLAAAVLASPATAAEPRPPSAVISARAGTFVLPPSYATWSLPSGVPLAPTMAHATVATPLPADPDLPRLDRALVLRRGEVVRFHLAFVPMYIGFSHGLLRSGWFEPGWFGRTPRTWTVPRRAKRGRAFLDATDRIGNRLTYSFDFVVRRSR
jgi:hypothetical protein